MRAAVRNQSKCVRILKTKPSVDWNLKDNDGRSALKLAVKFGRADCLEILLEVPGIDLSMISKKGRNIAQSILENLDFLRTTRHGYILENAHFWCLELLRIPEVTGTPRIKVDLQLENSCGIGQI